MLKAVIRKGAIVPLEPLPAEWGDGKEVSVTESESDDGPMDAERLKREAVEWVRAVREAATPFDADDWETLDTAVKEIRREERERMRREMGLP